MTKLLVKPGNLEKLYTKFNNKKYISPDPLEFLYKYSNPKDIEVVGLIASSLAYGRVCQILKSVNLVLAKLGSSPYQNLINLNDFNIFLNFKHRFTTALELINFLKAIKNVLIEYKTLENLFINSIYKTYKISKLEDFKLLTENNFDLVQKNYKELLYNFVASFELGKSSLLPNPAKHSACKRINLFLKWMIRKDNVDPGIWNSISPEILIIPLDTHIFKFAKNHKLTNRNTADFNTAIEITNNLRKINSLDPTKFDFAITRFGIRDDLKN